MYRILLDYRTEGFLFKDEEFGSVDAAVKFATENNYGNPFFIVQVVDWEATPKKK